MALGTKLGIGVAVIAVGGVGLWGWNSSRKAPENPPVATATPNAVEEAPTPAPEPMRTEPPVSADADEPARSGNHADSLGSPLPPGPVPQTSERSFRARPEAPADLAPLPEPQQREEVTSLAPRLDAPAGPAGPAALSEPPQAMTATPVITPEQRPEPQPAPLVSALPVIDKPAASQPAAPKPIEHVIAAGDTYSSLAEKYLGSARHADLIAKANPGKHPRRLLVGARIKIPAEQKTAGPSSASKAPADATTAEPVRRPAESLPPVAAERAYKVKPGESWNQLAQQFLGDSHRWPELYELNKDRVPKDPQALRSGMVIELPPQARLTSRPS